MIKQAFDSLISAVEVWWEAGGEDSFFFSVHQMKALGSLLVRFFLHWLMCLFVSLVSDAFCLMRRDGLHPQSSAC